MAQKFGISSLAEAEAYLQHPTLGPRLMECTKLVNQVDGKTASQIFGFPDNMKFRSCMTLFAEATNESEDFVVALRKYFDGMPDPRTLELLRRL